MTGLRRNRVSGAVMDETLAQAPASSPGLDLERLTPWIRTHVCPDVTSLSAELIEGGKSNLTYVVSTGVSSWILRRPPLGHVLATAHDMAREFRVMSALGGTDVPVPGTTAYCADTELLGAPFYLMELVVGTPYRHAAELEGLGSQRVCTISTGLVETLAALHRIEPGAVGLEDFGRPEGFVERQVSRWHQQFQASMSRELPAVDRLHEALARRVPLVSPAGIVHGDYRLDNVLFGADDRPTAVIDWEMATLGDPLTDLALLLLYRQMPEVVGKAAASDASSAEGFLGEDEILQVYAAGSDRDLSHLDFYVALAAFKLAGISEGIHYRHLQGQTVGDGFDTIGEVVAPLLELGLTKLQE